MSDVTFDMKYQASTIDVKVFTPYRIKATTTIKRHPYNRERKMSQVKIRVSIKPTTSNIIGAMFISSGVIPEGSTGEKILLPIRNEIKNTMVSASTFSAKMRIDLIFIGFSFLNSTDCFTD
jgi:hypothetical protein